MCFDISFALKSDKGIYTYLEQIRNLEGCQSAWLFGDELHVTLRSREDASMMKAAIDTWKDPSIRWNPIVPSIEDQFMSLIQQGPDNESENLE